MKKLFFGLIIVVIVAVFALVVLGIKIKNDLLVPLNRNSQEKVLFEVGEGSGTTEIVANLKQQGLIKNDYWVEAFARLTKLQLRSGVFELSPAMNALQILQKIESGDVIDIKVTTIEGWRAEEIGRKLNSEELLDDNSEFRQALLAKNWPELNQFKLKPDTLIEGFLFPDTYQFVYNSALKAILKKMVGNFISRTNGLNLTYNDLILASIVEREALHDEDRARIAGVYQNRLQIGMKLDADPTVQYGKANNTNPECSLNSNDPVFCPQYDFWPKLVRSDYQSVNSPWNTYRNSGLPPTPIANPGLASIEAALDPEDHDFLYFVTDKDGKAHFARTLAEHNENIREFVN